MRERNIRALGLQAKLFPFFPEMQTSSSKPPSFFVKYYKSCCKQQYMSPKDVNISVRTVKNWDVIIVLKLSSFWPSKKQLQFTLFWAVLIQQNPKKLFPKSTEAREKNCWFQWVVGQALLFSEVFVPQEEERAEGNVYHSFPLGHNFRITSLEMIKKEGFFWR